jgi:hypothetical protein
MIKIKRYEPILKFNNDEYNNLKSTGLLIFECVECGCDFKKEKRYYTSYLKGTHKGSIIYCSRKCEGDSKRISIKNNCKNCNIEIIKPPSVLKKSKSGNIFCSHSCSAKYSNTHKITGTRRSKLEVWIEENLKNKYDFEIIFNGKEAIESELDIYIPSLKLAFELNGIFHYESIYGDRKLEQVKSNDNRKFQACLENKIELCIIDSSGSKKFKPERDRKYLDIIESIINNKIKN